MWAAEIHGPSKDNVECLREEKEEFIVFCSCLPLVWFQWGALTSLYRFAVIRDESIGSSRQTNAMSENP